MVRANAAVLTGASNVNPAGILQIDTTAPTVPIITSIALGGVGGNHWVITGTAEANSNVAIFDGVTQLSTVITAVAGLITGATQVAPQSIVWIQSGSDTIVYANTSGVAENQGSADMEIVLTNVTARVR
jgi:hypothetical protein